MTHRAVKKMLCAWTCSVTIYCPPILFWEYIIGKSTVPIDACFYEFNNIWNFLLVFALSALIIPTVFVSYFNITICWRVRESSQERRSRQSVKNTNVPPTACPGKSSSLYFVKIHHASQDTEESSSSSQNTRHSSVLTKEQSSTPPFTAKDNDTKPPKYTLSNHDKANHSKGATPKLSDARASKDIQIAKSLSIIVGIFSVCWTPYCILMVIRAACHGTCIESYWYEITFWLLWINSFINPFLYPLCHSSFKKAFAKMLFSKC